MLIIVSWPLSAAQQCFLAENINLMKLSNKQL
jgi:hypothetical protein